MQRSNNMGSPLVLTCRPAKRLAMPTSRARSVPTEAPLLPAYGPDVDSTAHDVRVADVRSPFTGSACRQRLPHTFVSARESRIKRSPQCSTATTLRPAHGVVSAICGPTNRVVRALSHIRAIVPSGECKSIRGTSFAGLTWPSARSASHATDSQCSCPIRSSGQASHEESRAVDGVPCPHGGDNSSQQHRRPCCDKVVSPSASPNNVFSLACSDNGQHWGDCNRERIEGAVQLHSSASYKFTLVAQMHNEVSGSSSHLPSYMDVSEEHTLLSNTVTAASSPTLRAAVDVSIGSKSVLFAVPCSSRDTTVTDASRWKVSTSKWSDVSISSPRPPMHSIHEEMTPPSMSMASSSCEADSQIFYSDTVRPLREELSTERTAAIRSECDDAPPLLPEIPTCDQMQDGTFAHEQTACSSNRERRQQPKRFEERNDETLARPSARSASKTVCQVRRCSATAKGFSPSTTQPRSVRNHRVSPRVQAPSNRICQHTMTPSGRPSRPVGVSQANRTVDAANIQRAREQRRRELYAWNEMLKKTQEETEDAV